MSTFETEDNNTLRRSKRRNKYHLDVAAMLTGNNPDRRLSPPPLLKINNAQQSGSSNAIINGASMSKVLKLSPTPNKKDDTSITNDEIKNTKNSVSPSTLDEQNALLIDMPIILPQGN